MKKSLLFILTIGFSINSFSQYTGFSIGAGYTLAPTTFSPAIFNIGSTQTYNSDGSINMTTTDNVVLEKESFLGGYVPIEMEFFSKYCNFFISGNVPIGMTSKGKEFIKMYDTPILKAGVSVGAWAGPVGIFGGGHFSSDFYRVKNFQSVRFPNVMSLSGTITNESAAQDYYISKMNINNPGVDFHLLFGERFLIKASFYYDFSRIGRKSMNLGDQKIKGHTLTPELSFYFPFTEDKSFGIYLKAAYKMRVIKGVNDFTMDNAGNIPGYFPTLKSNQFLITLGFMLPPGIFGSATSSPRRVTTITIIE